MVLRFVNSRLSLGPRLLLLAAALAVPVVLLCTLLVRRSWREIAVADRELRGVAYLQAIWPLYNSAVTGAPEAPGARENFERARARFDRGFWTPALSSLFVYARSPDERVEHGQALIRTAADRSDLILDSELDSFYLANAVAHRLPALAKAAADLGRAEAAGGAPLARAARMGSAFDQVQYNATATKVSLNKAMAANADGKSFRALAGPTAALSNAADALTAEAGAAAEGVSADGRRLKPLQDGVERRVDETWRAAMTELRRRLEARRLRLLTALWTSLALVLVALSASAAIGWAIVSGLEGRARGLLSAIGRLVEGDLSVAVPYRDEPGEIGRIASGVQALKQATEERARLAAELERANRTLRDQGSWVRLAHEAGRMGAWRRRLPGDRVDISPELAQLMGVPAEATPASLKEIEPFLPDPDLLRRFVEDRERLTADELPPELIVPFRRPDTGEVRWFLLRRELVEDPRRQTRQVVGVAIDITDRKHMMDELNHRVKNNLATVLSLAMQTAKSTQDVRQFVKLFTGRIQALSKVNELLTRHAWAEVRVREVVMAALSPWVGQGLEVRDGPCPDLAMSARPAVSLCLVLHELGHSAVRRGTLAADGGKVEVAWSQPDARHAVLTWTEHRANPSQAPGEDIDAGAPMIERLIRGDLGGSADFDFQPEGLHARISFALAGATA